MGVKIMYKKLTHGDTFSFQAENGTLYISEATRCEKCEALCQVNACPVQDNKGFEGLPKPYIFFEPSKVVGLTKGGDPLCKACASYVNDLDEWLKI